mmetsp:Transcript_14791/g.41633  ORF Transcript_14791/g.41633 Transcript_14791/m.41633 type:complete len:241 (+) Transcript_14791:89-811(+)
MLSLSSFCSAVVFLLIDIVAEGHVAGIGVPDSLANVAEGVDVEEGRGGEARERHHLQVAAQVARMEAAQRQAEAEAGQEAVGAAECFVALRFCIFDRCERVVPHLILHGDWDPAAHIAHLNAEVALPVGTYAHPHTRYLCPKPSVPIHGGPHGVLQQLHTDVVDVGREHAEAVAVRQIGLHLDLGGVPEDPLTQQPRVGNRIRHHLAGAAVEIDIAHPACPRHLRLHREMLRRQHDGADA